MKGKHVTQTVIIDKVTFTEWPLEVWRWIRKRHPHFKEAIDRSEQKFKLLLRKGAMAEATEWKTTCAVVIEDLTKKYYEEKATPEEKNKAEDKEFWEDVDDIFRRLGP
jgi:hypothetical protein